MQSWMNPELSDVLSFKNTGAMETCKWPNEPYKQQVKPSLCRKRRSGIVLIKNLRPARQSSPRPADLWDLQSFSSLLGVVGLRCWWGWKDAAVNGEMWRAEEQIHLLWTSLYDRQGLAGSNKQSRRTGSQQLPLGELHWGGKSVIFDHTETWQHSSPFNNTVKEIASCSRCAQELH